MVSRLQRQLVQKTEVMQVRGTSNSWYMCAASRQIKILIEEAITELGLVLMRLKGRVQYGGLWIPFLGLFDPQFQIGSLSVGVMNYFLSFLFSQPKIKYNNISKGWKNYSTTQMELWENIRTWNIQNIYLIFNVSYNKF